MGSDLGGLAGEALGGMVSRLLGRGAYRLRKNSVMNGSNAMPRIATLTDGFAFSHKEFLFDIAASGSTAWSITNTFNLNPGLANVFTYVSQIAVAFEEWEADQIVIVIEPSSGALSTTQALGTLQVATQYDLQDAAFASQAEMLDYEYATTNRPDMPILHPVECDPRLNQLARFYVRTGLITGTTTTLDPRYNAYDIGRVSIAQAGVPATAGTVLAKCFVTYTFRFYKPKLYAGLTGYNLLHDCLVPVTVTVTSGNITAISAPASTANSNLGGVFTASASAVTYAFPPQLGYGNFLAYISIGSFSGSITQLESVTSNFTRVNCTNTANMPSNASGTAALLQSGVSTESIVITGPGATLTTSQANQFGVLVGSGTFLMQIYIAQCPGTPF